MAFNKKNKRKIIVDKNTYFWSATGNDGWINLCVITDVEGSSRLTCKFDYHFPLDSKNDSVLRKQFVITPYTVRQTIIYALSVGWEPFKKGKDFNLHHIDDKIDLRLDENRAFNNKDLWFRFSLKSTGKTIK